MVRVVFALVRFDHTTLVPVLLREIDCHSYRTPLMNHIRQAYKDTKNVKDEFLINAFIDEGFLTLKNFDNFLKLKKKKPSTEDDTFIIHL